jgi:hypothetical protein
VDIEMALECEMRYDKMLKIKLIKIQFCKSKLGKNESTLRRRNPQQAGGVCYRRRIKPDQAS